MAGARAFSDDRRKPCRVVSRVATCSPLKAALAAGTFLCANASSCVGSQGWCDSQANATDDVVLLQHHQHLQGQQKCGGAIGGVDGKTCSEALWGPTHDSSMPCFEYGDACTLNCKAPDHDVGKDPSQCHNKDSTFYLWDEPDTNCGVPDPYTWAGQTWLAYSKKWSAQIMSMRGKGFKFTSPLVKGNNILMNLDKFYAGCGAACSDKNDAAYIDINAVNCYCGSWNTDGCGKGASFCVSEAEKAKEQRAIYITNWSYLGADATPAKELSAMTATPAFFASPAVKRVYWFGAKDVGGGSDPGVLYLTNKVPGRQGKTFGDLWADICSKL